MFVPFVQFPYARCDWFWGCIEYPQKFLLKTYLDFRYVLLQEYIPVDIIDLVMQGSYLGAWEYHKSLFYSSYEFSEFVIPINEVDTNVAVSSGVWVGAVAGWWAAGGADLTADRCPYRLGFGSPAH